MMNFDAFFRCCVAVLVLFVERIEMYISKAEEIENAVKSDGSYGVPAGLVSSFPITKKETDNWCIVPDLILSEYGKRMLANTVRELESERDMVKDMLGS